MGYLSMQILSGVRRVGPASSADLGDWLCKMLGICA
jgi:hypothetical protein